MDNLERAQGRAPRVLGLEHLAHEETLGKWSGSAGKRDGFGVLDSPQHHQRAMKRWKRWSGTSHNAIGWESKKQWPQAGMREIQDECREKLYPWGGHWGHPEGLCCLHPWRVSRPHWSKPWASWCPFGQKGELGLSQPHLTYHLLILTNWKWGTTALNTLNKWQCFQADSSCTEPEITRCRCDGQHPTSKLQVRLFFPFCFLKVFEKLLRSVQVFPIETTKVRL